MADASPSIPPAARLPARVRAYLDDVVAACAPPAGPLASLVLFGSAATGAYAAAVSDVDLLLVVADGTDAAERRRVRERVAELELQHDFGKPPRPSAPGSGVRGGPLAGAVGGRLAAFADRVTANVRSFFVCSRADLLSGDPGRVLGLPPAQARFVDRVALPSILASGVTVWGEDLLGRVPLPPVRRLDVGKAWLGLHGQVVLSAALYPLLPGATRYAMDALKRSVHSCYFCHHARPAPLADEVAFLAGRHGPDGAVARQLARLLALRGDYRPSFGFVVGCVPALARLHARTARDVRFPRAARPDAGPA